MVVKYCGESFEVDEDFFDDGSHFGGILDLDLSLKRRLVRDGVVFVFAIGCARGWLFGI